MADYIYLLTTRLTAAQQTALEHVREAARAHGMTVFLVGGAVRDLTSGSPIRDLDIAIQGDALSLRGEIERLGGTLIGQNEPRQTLYFNFPRGVRLEVGSTLSVTYPEPAKPEFHPASILDDLRCRDFTANAMAISLNEGSYGLLMDPLNGVADIENRELRLVSNYGFIEDPARLIRAARFSARFGWQMEEKTQQRYETAKAEGYINAITPAQAGYELEEVFHEEDPLRVWRRLELEGWMQSLFPAWNSSQANEPELDRLRDLVGQFEQMSIHPDPSPAFFPLLTAKLSPNEVAELKSRFARPGFVDQIAALETDTRAMATQFSSKAAAAPSDTWKMLFASAPEPVLWLAYTTKSAPLKSKFDAFFNVWSQARSKIPYQLMQEMRITPDLPGYEELLDQLFFAILDEKMETTEAAKAFLEPFSPPAPPPPVNLRRRPVKRESKAAKPRSKKSAEPIAAETVATDELSEPIASAEAPTASPSRTSGKTPSAKPASGKAAAAGAAPAAANPAKAAKSAPAPAAATKSAQKAAAKSSDQTAALRPAANAAKTVDSAATKTAPEPAAAVAGKSGSSPAHSPTKESAHAAKAPAKAQPSAATPAKKSAPVPVKATKAAAQHTHPAAKGLKAPPAKTVTKSVAAKSSAARSSGAKDSGSKSPAAKSLGANAAARTSAKPAAKSVKHAAKPGQKRKR